jgi:hypothetical protein
LFSPTDPRQVTETVFTEVHIIRVGAPSAVPGATQPAGVTSSLTVVMTLCDAQYLDWLINNATLKYTLLSYKEYGSGATSATCSATTNPGVIGPKAVDDKWGFTKG